MKWPNFEVCIAEKYDIVQEIVKPQRTRKTNYMYTVFVALCTRAANATRTLLLHVI